MLNLNAIGRIGKDAVIKEINGQSKISYNIAVVKKRKRNDGTEVEETQWVSCLQSYHPNSKLPQYLRKGTLVYISGSLRVNIYDGKNGKAVGISCDVDKMELLTKPNEGEAQVSATQTDYTNSECAY